MSDGGADQRLVLDAAALCDLVLGTTPGRVVLQALAGREVHLSEEAEVRVLGALWRLRRSGLISWDSLRVRAALLGRAVVVRHRAADLLTGAEATEPHLRLGDAVSLELSRRLGAALITTNPQLAAV
ncbi:MAG: PIN domain-containing protein, partial [Candidatus Dormibacteria bacterium]